MTNGWSGILNELRAYDAINPLITDFYVISFFIFSVMITLNVFLAVMTSGIQDRLAKEKNQKPQGQMSENSDIQQEIASLKKSIEALREALDRKRD
jgi:peptidoglycan hydrolase CwlO-like protein